MFGRYAIADTRDLKATPKRRGVIKPKYWYSEYFGCQGDSSACVGFSWMHWLEAKPHRQYLDPFGIYKTAKLLDEWVGEDYDGTSVRAGAKLLQQLGFLKNYAWFKTPKEVMQWVSKEGPAVLGVNWYNGMVRPNKENIIKISGKKVGGHAVLIDGVKPGWVRIKNSWSRKWGKGGRAWLSEKDLGTLLKEDGEACSGVEVDVNAIVR